MNPLFRLSVRGRKIAPERRRNMSLKHKVTINVAKHGGGRSPVIQSSRRTIRSRMLDLLIEKKVSLLVITPGDSVETLESRKSRKEVWAMSKIKLLLDVVSDLRSLADSVQAVADAIASNAPDAMPKPKPSGPEKQPEENRLPWKR